MEKNNNCTETNPSCKLSRSIPPFSGSTLEQVLQFVLPDDVARVSMVCKTWRDELKPPTQGTNKASSTGVIMNSKSIWKQAVINSCPNVMQALIAANSSDEQKASAQIDFYALAKSGLGRKRKQPELHESSFRIQDLIIVLELKQKKFVKDENGEEKMLVKSLGTFSHNGNQDMLQDNACGKVDFDFENSPGIILEGQNPLCPDTYDDGDNKNGGGLLWENAKAKFHATLKNAVNRGDEGRWHQVTLPMKSAGVKMLDQLLVSVTLLRRDDWRSFCLFDNYEMDGHGYIVDLSLGKNHFETSGCPDWGRTNGQQSRGRGSPFARNGPGSVAHEVLASKEILDMQTYVNIEFKCMLPTPNSLDEPAWHKQFRRMRPADTEWTEQLDDEIARVKTFQFSLDSISLNLGAGYRDEYTGSVDVDDPNAFLLLLEGLDWK